MNMDAILQIRDRSMGDKMKSELTVEAVSCELTIIHFIYEQIIKLVLSQ